jgi:UDP-glucose 4-epimerase
MKSIVTGGAGFIGSHIVDKLIELGHEVIVIDNLSAECNDKFYFNQSAKNFKYDVCDYKNTRWLYDNVDYVFHLAAESRLQPAILNPIKAMEKNVVGTCTVLQCAKEAGVKTVVYSSTSSGYGLNDYPNVETQPDDCLNPYSVSKVAGEKLCKMYTDLYGLKTISFRYFNVYGERSPSKGQYALVLGIFKRQKDNELPLTIVGDGSQRRDFIHVDDVVMANICAITNSLETKYYGQVYNIGSGENISIIDIAKIMSNNYTFIPERIGEIHTTLANIDKVKSVLGWKPKIKVIDWIKNLV